MSRLDIVKKQYRLFGIDYLEKQQIHVFVSRNFHICSFIFKNSQFWGG